MPKPLISTGKLAKSLIANYPNYIIFPRLQEDIYYDTWRAEMGILFPEITSNQLQKLRQTAVEASPFSPQWLLDEMRTLAMGRVSLEDLLRMTVNQWEMYHHLKAPARMFGIHYHEIFRGILDQK